MKKVLTTLSVFALVAAGYAASATAANADGWHRGYGGYGGYGPGYYRGYHHHNGGGAALGAGLLGLGVGALIGGAIAYSYEQPRYYEPAPVYVAPPRYYRTEPVYVAPRPLYRVPAPVYYEAAPRYGATRANVRSHAAACEARYRTYDPRSDTFVGNDGYRHHCNY